MSNKPNATVATMGIEAESPASLRLALALGPWGRQSARHFCDLKYRKSGGAWFFFAGINNPSPLRK